MKQITRAILILSVITMVACGGKKTGDAAVKPVAYADSLASGQDLQLHHPQCDPYLPRRGSHDEHEE